MTTLQRWRYLSLALFFMAFFLVPTLDIFRYDLYEDHFILAGRPLRLDFGEPENLEVVPGHRGGDMVAFFDSDLDGRPDAGEKKLQDTELVITDAGGASYRVISDARGMIVTPAGFRLPVARFVLLTDADARRILLYLLVPFVLLGITLAWIARRWGRLYCGWLCPHYSVVEIINGLMRRASGRTTLWMEKPLPQSQADGTEMLPNAWWWAATVAAILLFSLLWAVGMLSYLLPPRELYFDLIHFSLRGWPLLAFSLLVFVFFLDFALARHLFCRYGCSVGILQSLFWMGNKQALVVGFDRSRARECTTCDASCAIACPMELPPRGVKRRKFSCTQCMLCIEACDRVQSPGGEAGLLRMLEGECALNESERGPGKGLQVHGSCFRSRVE